MWRDMIHRYSPLKRENKLDKNSSKYFLIPFSILNVKISSHTIDPHSSHLCSVHLLEQREGISHQDLLTAFPEKNLRKKKQKAGK